MGSWSKSAWVGKNYSGGGGTIIQYSSVGGEFSFFIGFHVRIDIFISIRPMVTKLGKQVHLQNLT